MALRNRISTFYRIFSLVDNRSTIHPVEEGLCFSGSLLLNGKSNLCGSLISETHLAAETQDYLTSATTTVAAKSPTYFAPLHHIITLRGMPWLDGSQGVWSLNYVLVPVPFCCSVSKYSSTYTYMSFFHPRAFFPNFQQMFRAIFQSSIFSCFYFSK